MTAAANFGPVRGNNEHDAAPPTSSVFHEAQHMDIFYTYNVPLGCDSGIMLQIGDTVHGFFGLPFGWVHSPALAQGLLGMCFSVQHVLECLAP